MPHLQFFSYQRKKGNTLQEFKIKKKDYGEMVLYDIFYEDTFLFTVSQEGKVLLSNWEDARKEPVSVDENTLRDISHFIITRQSVSLQQDQS